MDRRPLHRLIPLGVAKGTPSFSVSSWIREDSFQYLVIAQHGLQSVRCTPQEQYAFLTTQCGTVGWLPGYPWMMRGLHTFGLSYAESGVIISGLAFYFVLYVVWWQLAWDLSAPRALVVLLTFGSFPGSVYNFAVFPMSLALLLCTGAVVAAIRQRFVLMGVLLLAGGLCYPTVWFAAVGLMVGVGLAAWSEGTRAIVTRVGVGIAWPVLNRRTRLLRAVRPSVHLLLSQEHGGRVSGVCIRQLRSHGETVPRSLAKFSLRIHAADTGVARHRSRGSLRVDGHQNPATFPTAPS